MNLFKRVYEYKPCVRCGRLVAIQRHMCPHGTWCRPYYKRRGVGEANDCPSCPDNGMSRTLNLRF